MSPASVDYEQATSTAKIYAEFPGVSEQGKVLARAYLAKARENAELRERVEALEETLDAIIGSAESWHGDDAAKGRALKVITTWAREALTIDQAASGQEAGLDAPWTAEDEKVLNDAFKPAPEPESEGERGA